MNQNTEVFIVGYPEELVRSLSTNIKLIQVHYFIISQTYNFHEMLAKFFFSK